MGPWGAFDDLWSHVMGISNITARGVVIRSFSMQSTQSTPIIFLGELNKFLISSQ